MKIWIAFTFVAFAAFASAQCPPCKTMKWANCDGRPCHCSVAVGHGDKQTLDCTKLIPKCFLMKAEMHRAREGQKTRVIRGKPEESADEKYDPECESDGKFKAKQCNNSVECWCVNSAGVRRTDKRDKNLKCDTLVQTDLVILKLTHKPISTPLDKTTLKAAIADAIHKRYMNFSKDLVRSVTYDPTKRWILVDVKMNGSSDTATMAYYMETDVKGLSLFVGKDEGFTPTVGGHRLEIEDITVNYIDEVPPDFSPKPGNLWPSIVVFVVVAVVLIALGIWCYRRRCQRRM